MDPAGHGGVVKSGLSAGDVALVTAAGGGIGVWLVPLLAAATGAFADVEELGEQRGIEVIGLHEEFTDEDMGRAADIALQRLAEGAVQPVIGQRLPLERAAEAHAANAERRVAGKSVLVP